MFSKLFTLSTVLGLLVAMPAKATMMDVVLGGPDGLIQYNPSFLNDVEPGTTIRFIFKQKNHTVTQSTLETPCSPLPGGFNTGFMPVAENKEPFPTALFTVNDTKPVWFYCQQTGHCQKGMVFALNPGHSGKLVTFQDNARNTPLTPPPSASPPSTPPYSAPPPLAPPPSGSAPPSLNPPPLAPPSSQSTPPCSTPPSSQSTLPCSAPPCSTPPSSESTLPCLTPPCSTPPSSGLTPPCSDPSCSSPPPSDSTSLDPTPPYVITSSPSLRTSGTRALRAVRFGREGA